MVVMLLDFCEETPFVSNSLPQDVYITNAFVGRE